MSPDDICGKYADQNVKLKVTTLPPGDDDPQTYILLQGTSEALRFLGELLIAQADFSDPGFFLAPNGPGNALFEKDSTLGIYIHRTEPAAEARPSSGTPSSGIV